MPRFAANLSMMYQEHEFLDRFAAAAQDGFEAVEFLFPYDFPAQELRRRLDENGLTQALFNAPPGDWAGGERGLASLPGREQEFRAGIAQALDYAAVLGNDRIHVMAGIVPAAQQRQRHRDCYLENLAYAARAAAAYGVTVLIEPINPRDMPGYLLNHQHEAHTVRQEVGATNLLVQFDFYHCQIVEGDVSMRLREGLAQGGIGHLQIAGVPHRQEPDRGELNYPWLFGLVDELGYDGWIGCEYRPRANTRDGLGWIRPWQPAR
ncbi:2-oxo-tetronate isomerase [Cupriavidus sp. AU9028]|uniref:2-oxo-tetronate isomerase n=1 Tax=Cupriavidus sp. AU9028 TaxID=2871157 RepID=UPI001C966B89|nr:2-oxo-tetronate isomerase [Cupriavidus sp. AU9028]MBY4897475.1 hydroxypyruvate isomerase family protein [Cupriavidus sp. AU9028]